MVILHEDRGFLNIDYYDFLWVRRNLQIDHYDFYCRALFSTS